MSFLTDQTHNSEHEYKTSEGLKKRQSLYSYTEPPLDLDGEILCLLESTQPENILEVGCGYGRLLEKIRKRGNTTAELVGIDISEGILAAAQESQEKQGLNIRYKKDDAQKLSFPDETFDTIITSHVLHHVEDIGQAVREAWRCLKKDGTYIVSLHSTKDRPNIVEYRKWIAKSFGRDEIANGCERVNFENFSFYLNIFKSYSSKFLMSSLVIPDTEIVLGYLSTHKDNFVSTGTEEQWNNAMEKIRADVELKRDRNGLYKEITAIGIYFAKK